MWNGQCLLLFYASPYIYRCRRLQNLMQSCGESYSAGPLKKTIFNWSISLQVAINLKKKKKKLKPITSHHTLLVICSYPKLNRVSIIYVLCDRTLFFFFFFNFKLSWEFNNQRELSITQSALQTSKMTFEISCLLQQKWFLNQTTSFVWALKLLLTQLNLHMKKKLTSFRVLQIMVLMDQLTYSPFTLRLSKLQPILPSGNL